MTDEPHNTDMAAYDRTAYAYCKTACVIWCLVGWGYAAFTWRLLWIPAILVFAPGIFVASLIAAMFFIPFWITMTKVTRDWETDHAKNWGLLVFATLLRIGGFVAPIAGSVIYVKLVQSILE